MESWEILGIEKTSDKKKIRKAYALRSKDCHPEEKPEEFKELYSAYQDALAYASAIEHRNKKPDEPASRSDDARPPTDDRDAHTAHAFSQRDNSTTDREYREAFQSIETEREKKWEKKRAACLALWEQCFTDRTNPVYLWEQFLKSKEFFEMYSDPQVQERICADLEQDQRDGGRIRDWQLKKLWDWYEFHPDEQALHSRAEARLYRCLYPAWKRANAVQEMLKTAERENKRKADRRKRYLVLAAKFCVCGVILSLILLTMGTDRRLAARKEKTRERAEQYLLSQYPESRFVCIGSNEQVEGGISVQRVQFSLEEEPGIHVTVELTGAGESGEARITSKYGGQEIQELLEEAGLEFLYWHDRVVLLYRDFEDIKAFSTRLLRFAEDERVKSYYFLFNNTAVCSGDFHAQRVMIYGGDGGLPPQKLYSLEHLPEQEELERELVERHIEYLYNYEAWNLTEAMDQRYGEEYRSRIFPEEYLQEGVSAVPTFMLDDTAEQPEGSEEQSGGSGNSVEYITVGNLYQYLKAGGVSISVYPDGRGFSVSIDDTLYKYDVARADSYVTLEHAEELLAKWMNCSP